ncbi:MAG: hypothetical protein KF716_11690 [Anaerolineae bacterium]|nr:hypothetical protein [Anaerolineae bacterium]
MDPTTLNVLLGIAIVLGIISLGVIAVGLRPQPKAEPTHTWPPKFYFPLASDASLLVPRKTQTGSNSMPTVEMKLHTTPADIDDEEPTARQLDLNKISELADKTGPKRVGNVPNPDATNKNVIDANAANIGKSANPPTTNDPDVTNKQVLK